MTRDGLIEVNETQQTAERISSREADSDFSKPDSAAAERAIEHSLIVHFWLYIHICVLIPI